MIHSVSVLFWTLYLKNWTGLENTNVIHFVFQKSSFISVRVCFLCTPLFTCACVQEAIACDMFAWHLGMLNPTSSPLCACWNNDCCQINPDCFTLQICCGLYLAWLHSLLPITFLPLCTPPNIYGDWEWLEK